MAYIHHITAHARRSIQFPRTCVFHWRPWLGPRDGSGWVRHPPPRQLVSPVLSSHRQTYVILMKGALGDWGGGIPMHAQRSTPARWVATPQCQPTNTDSRSLSPPPAPQPPVQSNSCSLTINRMPGSAPAKHQALSSARLTGMGQLTERCWPPGRSACPTPLPGPHCWTPVPGQSPITAQSHRSHQRRCPLRRLFPANPLSQAVPLTWISMTPPGRRRCHPFL